MIASDRFAGLAALMAAGLAVYGVSLWFVASTRDELILLSSAAHAQHPLGYFAGDWGLGNQMYRPIFSTIEWASYRVFGVWALPNQLLSLALHVTVIALLFDLLLRVGQPRGALGALMLSLTALISPYTMTGASWVVDRPTVMVALCVMLAVRELLLSEAPRPRRLALFAVLAMLSKESGVVVPGLMLTVGVIERQRGLAVAGAAPLLAYGLLRVTMFGRHAATYPESGVLLGVWPYVNSSELSLRQFFVMLIDNPARHVLATVLPVFGAEGENPPLDVLWSMAPLWVPTAALILLAAGRPSRPQRLAIAIVLLNAISHFALFRTRTMYLSQVGLVLYVATSEMFISPHRRRLAAALAIVLVCWNTGIVAPEIASDFERRYEALSSAAARDFKIEDEITIDPRIIDAVTRQPFER